MKIDQAVALISGGGSGMGAATALHLAKLGAKVVLLDQAIENATKIAKEINGHAYHCDVSDALQVEKIIEQVVRAHKNIHIVVNCAGIGPAARIVSRDGPMPLEDFNRVIQINLIGTFNIMRVVSAQMIKQLELNDDNERGVIINTASVAAFEGQIGQAAYSASKGGVVSMTLPAAREFARFGIRVMTIAPGIIATPMMASMPEEVEKSLKALVPFPNRLGYPQEYASLVEHIICNPYLNGEVIRLDGALRMPAK